jgi:heptosyltransferase-2
MLRFKLKKILVIQQKMIGDVLAGTVICRAIKEKFPDCEVHYMIQPQTKAVVDGNPFVDKTIIFDPAGSKGLFGLMDFGKKLRVEKYDAVIDAYGKWESIIPAWKSGAKVRIGFRKWYTSFFYTKTVEPKDNIPGSAIYHRLQLAEVFTGKISDIIFPQIYLSESEIKEAKNNISQAGLDQQPLLMISVMGSSTSKSLPPQQMAETLNIIASEGNMKLLFNFMPNQKAEAEEIFNFCAAETREKILFDFPIKGLRPFLAVLSQCDALIGNEGGAVNMSKALGIPTFTIFSPWINKSSWDMLTDTDNHVAVHLNDYFPEIYQEKHPKKLKNRSAELYQKLIPQLYREQLQAFTSKFIR